MFLFSFSLLLFRKLIKNQKKKKREKEIKVQKGWQDPRTQEKNNRTFLFIVE